MSEEISCLKKIWNNVVNFIKSLFGKAKQKVSEQKEKIHSVSILTNDALTLLKSGDITTAVTKLEEAVNIINKITNNVNKVVTTVKEVKEKI